MNEWTGRLVSTRTGIVTENRWEGGRKNEGTSEKPSSKSLVAAPASNTRTQTVLCGRSQFHTTNKEVSNKSKISVTSGGGPPLGEMRLIPGFYKYPVAFSLTPNDDSITRTKHGEPSITGTATGKLSGPPLW